MSTEQLIQRIRMAESQQEISHLADELEAQLQAHQDRVQAVIAEMGELLTERADDWRLSKIEFDGLRQQLALVETAADAGDSRGKV